MHTSKPGIDPGRARKSVVGWETVQLGMALSGCGRNIARYVDLPGFICDSWVTLRVCSPLPGGSTTVGVAAGRGPILDGRREHESWSEDSLIKIKKALERL